jgi:hypothetical protein
MVGHEQKSSLELQFIWVPIWRENLQPGFLEPLLTCRHLATFESTDSVD